jgi:hypothetical protein
MKQIIKIKLEFERKLSSSSTGFMAIDNISIYKAEVNELGEKSLKFN